MKSLNLTPEDISKIDAIDEETAKELINRSKETLVKKQRGCGRKIERTWSRRFIVNLQKELPKVCLLYLDKKILKN